MPNPFPGMDPYIEARGRWPDFHHEFISQCVTRAASSDRCDVYPWSVRQPLPTIRLPLRPADPDVSLDLAGVLARTYEVGRYDRLVRHGQPVELPLSPTDTAWVAERAMSGGADS